jgi:hypothetical protein
VKEQPSEFELRLTLNFQGSKVGLNWSSKQVYKTPMKNNEMIRDEVRMNNGLKWS